MTEPHPQRCETCRNTKGAKIGDCEYYRICLKTNKRIWGYQAKFTSLVGCVSHSTAQESRVKVLDELEQLLCAHHKYVGSYRVITGTNEEIYDELFDAIQKLRQQERKP